MYENDFMQDDYDGYDFTAGVEQNDNYSAEADQIFFFDAFGNRFPSRRRRSGCDWRMLGCRRGRCRGCRDRFFFR